MQMSITEMLKTFVVSLQVCGRLFVIIIMTSLGTHERADCLAFLSARVSKCLALFKRTATITQAGVGSQTLRPGTVVFKHRVAPSQSRIYLHQ